MASKRVRAAKPRARRARRGDLVLLVRIALRIAGGRTMRDSTRSVRRADMRRAKHPEGPPEPSRRAAQCVVGALLRGQPELTLLTKAVEDVAKLELVDDRLTVVSTILAARPLALVLPPFDAEHTSTAPLVLRARREAPGVAVLVVSGRPVGAGQPMLRAAQAGAYVITSPTAAELRKALLAHLDPEVATQ